MNLKSRITLANSGAVTPIDHQSRDPRNAMALALKDESRAELRSMWRLAITGLEKALRSKNPDVQHAAREQFLKYLTAGDQDATRRIPRYF